MQKTKQVAARVNGEKVYEEQITEYIEGFRNLEGNYETDSSWAEYLARCGYTAETLRLHILNSVFIPRVLVVQQCKKKNITVSESELNNSLQAEKNRYELKYGTDTWNSVLSSYGYDEQSWADTEEFRLLQLRLKDSLFKKQQPSKAALKNEIVSNRSVYTGKHSYYVSFKTLSEAKHFYESLSKNSKDKLIGDGKESFLEHKTRVDAGWNCVSSDRLNMTNEYVSELNNLSRNQISWPLKIREHYFVIWCDKIYSVKKNTQSVNLSNIPSAIYDELVKNASINIQDKHFDEWLEEVREDSKIIVYDMPKHLPYDVDIPLRSSS